MEFVQTMTEYFNKQIKNIDQKFNLSKSNKYDEVCISYAILISSVSKYRKDINLKDLLPITNIFHDYQRNYFGISEGFYHSVNKVQQIRGVWNE
ncbi:hypothetical protein J5Y03_10185 [Bacillus sp. RG28]|uniref:Uncharacterized protein n=1 Tax=Gottfriedia endophytica TaxID=2820819 RepID=A0A940NMY3_9BACI|nr:hypothetical protein [Gottfriedia endophytica]MBP0725556.1 hypothetical protein [Gottfriedia endophytica]